MRYGLAIGLAILLMVVGGGSRTRGAVTFHAPFDDSVDAVVAGGDGAELNGRDHAFVDGIKGNGVLLKGQVLSYLEPGNLSNAKGSLEMWVKFVDANLTKNHMLFYEGSGSNNPGDQNLRMFTLSNGALFCSVSDVRRHWFTSRFPLNESMGCWRYIVLTWDKDQGMRLYVDGKMTMRDYAAGDRGMNFKRETKAHEKFFLSNNMCTLALDEVRVHDRVLKAEEVSETYRSLHPLALRSTPFLFNAGEEKSMTLTFDNDTDQAVSGVATYSVTDPDGQLVIREKGGSRQVEPSGDLALEFGFKPEQAGTYRLAYTFNNMSRFAELTVLPKQETESRKEVNPELALKAVKEFDCTRDYGPDEFVDDGTSRVTESPMGKYRETGAVSWSRFAYRFAVDEPQTPYLAVVEYPDDKARVMEIMIDNASNKVYQTVENGLITGDEYPNDNTFHEFRLLFYPTDEECALIVMNWPISAGRKAVDAPCVPAACKSIKIYKVLNGIPEVKLCNLPPKHKQRLVGYDNEDASFIREFSGNLQSTRENPVTFDDMRRMMERRVDYMAFTGQNLLAYPIYHYNGALYPSQNINRAGKLVYHPGPWVELMLNLCEERDITFIPAICFREVAELKSAPADQETIVSGQDTPYAVSWKGEVGGGHNPRYDILHPQVQEHLLNLVDDIVGRYGDSPAFGGLSFWLGCETSLWLPDLKWGYSDRNINAFEKDTGVKVPGDVPDAAGGGASPHRFVKRYVFLTKKDPGVREKWIAWRCEKVKQAWMRVHDRLREKNPNFILNMELWGLWAHTRGDYLRQDHWTPGDENSVYDFYRRGGIDAKLFGDAPGLYIGHVLYHNLRPADGVYLWRDFELSPALVAPFQNQGRNTVWLEQLRREFDSFHWSKPMDGFWWDDGKGDKRGHLEKSGGIMAHGDFYLEYYAKSLADWDVRYITDGGITLTTLGHEDALREFIRAFRTIPAEHFPVFKGVEDPLCVRARKCDDGYYFYLVNRDFYPVTAELTFDAGGKFDLLDLPLDKWEQVADKRTVTVGPFRVMSFRAPTGVALKDVSVSIPPERVTWLAGRVSEFKRSVVEVEKLGFDDRRLKTEVAWIGREIDRAWEEKRYSRLRHLLFSFHVRKLRRILGDPEYRGYVAVPQVYKDAFYDPSFTLKAVKMDSIPSIGAKAWGGLTATDMFSEVDRIDGQYRPRPAGEKTEVAIAYDDRTLGLLFRCFDGNVDRLTAIDCDHDAIRLSSPKDDCVEIHLSNSPENVPYYHFGANYGGSRRDRNCPDKAKWYNPEWTVEKEKHDDRWEILLKIPFKELERTPGPGDSWGVNLCRNQRGVYSALRCDPQKGFHCPKYFAKLQF